MKLLLKLEGLALLVAGTLGYGYNFDSWLWYGILFLSPDIGMLGYLVNPKIGAITYNLFHHLLVAAVVLAIGYYFDMSAVFLYGWVMVAHIGFDRILGYGLKFPDDFKHTHLD